jgi:hypothetical protein
MSRLIIVEQEKGGSAKTSISANLIPFLRGLGHNYRPVDFDYTAGQLVKIFPDCASLSPDVNLLRSGESRLPEFMERVLAGQLFLVDCGANTFPAWQTLFSEVWPDLHEQLASKQVKTTLIVPITSDEKTHQCFASYKVLWPGATVIMVRLRQYREQPLSAPAHPPELTIDLPLAPARLFNTYLTHAMTFEAIAQTSDPALSIDQGFAKGYLPQLYATFRKIQTHLLP